MDLKNTLPKKNVDYTFQNTSAYKDEMIARDPEIKSKIKELRTALGLTTYVFGKWTIPVFTDESKVPANLKDKYAHVKKVYDDSKKFMVDKAYDRSQKFVQKFASVAPGKDERNQLQRIQ